VKILLIVNASASSVTARGRVVIQKALSADHEVRVAATSRRGHATRLAQGAAASDTDVVVVLGGDGTLNEAANGLAGTTTALAALPGGSTNVFARTLGLSDDPVEATATLLEALSKNAVRSVGLGSVNGRYFLFHTGVGYDAAVVEQVEKRGPLKRYAGHPLFMWSAVDTWLRHYDHRSPGFALHYPDGTVVDSPFAIVMNTNPYTYLGTRPFDIAPDAGLQRPLAVVALTSMRLLTLSRVAAAALRSGSGLGSSKHVHYQPNVHEVTVRGHRPVPYQVDGDHLGDADELVFRYEPDVLPLVVPDSRAITR
jgi:diacylglycerol kinase family enzyme